MLLLCGPRRLERHCPVPVAGTDAPRSHPVLLLGDAKLIEGGTGTRALHLPRHERNVVPNNNATEVEGACHRTTVHAPEVLRHIAFEPVPVACAYRERGREGIGR